MSTNKPSGSIRATQTPQRAVLPAVDVYEDDAGITLLADMPGVPKDQLELKVEADTLSIEGGVRHADARRPGSGVRRSARAALPPHLHAEPRARHVEESTPA